MSLVVTGATGQLGRLVVLALLEKGVAADQIVATARDTSKIADLAEKGVDVRQADYNNPDSLSAAFDGAERILLISGNEVGQRVPQHQNVIDVAKQAGVQLLAYTSIPHADTNDMLLAKEHRATEEAIIASGLSRSFLRNSWYFENYLMQLPAYLERGTVLGAAGDGKVSAAARADYAEAAATVLLADQPAAVYELGGTAFTLTELATTVAEASGREVAYTNLPADELSRALVGAGLPEQHAAVLADGDLGLGRGELYVDTADLEGLLGRPASSLADAVKAAL